MPKKLEMLQKLNSNNTAKTFTFLTAKCEPHQLDDTAMRSEIIAQTVQQAYL